MDKITCAERDALLLDPATGRVSDRFSVYSSLTDAHGQFGEPRIETTWGDDTGLRIQDVRHPKLGQYTPPDEKPCEHYRWVETDNEE